MCLDIHSTQHTGSAQPNALNFPAHKSNPNTHTEGAVFLPQPARATITQARGTTTAAALLLLLCCRRGGAHGIGFVPLAAPLRSSSSSHRRMATVGAAASSSTPAGGGGGGGGASNPFSGKKVHQSALALLPEEGTPLYAAIQAIRREHDKQFYRWMPHINV